MADFEFTTPLTQTDSGSLLLTKTQNCLNELRIFWGAKTGSTSVLDHENLAHDAGIRSGQLAGDITRTQLATAGTGRGVLSDNCEPGSMDAGTIAAGAVSQRTAALRDSPRYLPVLRTAEAGLTVVCGAQAVTIANGTSAKTETVAWADDDAGYSGTPTRWRITLTAVYVSVYWALVAGKIMVEAYWDNADGTGFDITLRRFADGGGGWALANTAGDEPYMVHWRAVLK